MKKPPPIPEPDYEYLAEAFEFMQDMTLTMSSQAVALKSKFEAQGWSPAVAEHMAHQVFTAMLAASTS